MSTSNGPGGTAPSAGGASDKTQNNTTQTETFSPEERAKLLEHKDKLLTEKKKLQERLDAFEAKEREREEAEAKAKGEIDKLLKLREEELARYKNENETIKTNLQNGVKLRALLEEVQGSIDDQYWSLIDLKDVVIDPNTGMPDPASVQKAAREFEQRYPLVISRAAGGSLPNDAAKGGATKLTYDEWLKLPSKEQKARLKEVMGS